MGEIIGSRTIGDRVIYKIMVNGKESLTLKGSMKNIRLFSLDLCDAESRIIERGKGGVTKHFLIPAKQRSKSKKRLHSIFYQVIELDNKAIFIYTLDK